MIIEEHWKNNGSPRYITDSEEIESFIKKWIDYTGGSTNLDSIHGLGFADSLIRIDREDTKFLLYWKDYRDYFDKKELTEGEDIEIDFFGNYTFLYRIVDIRKVEIFKSPNNGIALVIYSNFMTEKDSIKFLKKRYQFKEHRIVSGIDQTIKEILFLDSNGYSHKCKIDLLPLSNLLLLQKIKPWGTVKSQQLLTWKSLAEIMDPISKIEKSIYLLEFDDEYRIREIINNIRYAVEGLLKLYYILTTIHNKNLLVDNEINPKVLANLMKKYGNVFIGELKNSLEFNVEDILPSSFIVDLNTYSHYSGKYPNKDILIKLLRQYKTLSKKLFDFESMMPRTFEPTENTKESE